MSSNFQRRLFHHPLSGAARKVRVMLAEKGLECEMKIEPVWERRREFLALNPSGDVPVLVDANGAAICDGSAVTEYLEEAYPDRPMLAGDPVARAEIRRLAAWFDVKFHDEVSGHLVSERFLKRVLRTGGPDASAIRAANHNIRYHLDYIGYLSDRRKWLAGDEFSLADIAAAAHLSCADYFGDVPWDNHPLAKDWYMRVKCRPSFRPLLADRVPGLAPCAHYAQLDF